jgi:hypothetical protein
MQGQITKFRSDLGIGIIRAEDGRSFRFRGSSLLNARTDLVGESVDFLLTSRRPKDIVVLRGSPWKAFGA